MADEAQQSALEDVVDKVITKAMDLEEMSDAERFSIVHTVVPQVVVTKGSVISRKTRAARDAERLAAFDPEAQTVEVQSYVRSGGDAFLRTAVSFKASPS